MKMLNPRQKALMPLRQTIISVTLFFHTQRAAVIVLVNLLTIPLKWHRVRRDCDAAGCRSFSRDRSLQSHHLFLSHNLNSASIFSIFTFIKFNRHAIRLLWYGVCRFITISRRRIFFAASYLPLMNLMLPLSAVRFPGAIMVLPVTFRFFALWRNCSCWHFRAAILLLTFRV